ncbi:hypothetical protein [Paenibacillus assamensis]|uniref:hypothetical protein n=1 Tax=Paenibacillus assamensis TaxID=311244 RepID=UPI00041A45D4|nr:hypothetical protein [Paenibacillus assamensis]
MNNQRYNIKFKQEEVGYVKPWRITDFIEKITTLHYKKELLKELSNRFEIGVKPENILLFEKSFNIHRSYSNLNENCLLTQRGAKFTYHLGNFISLYPNKDITAISLLFELFSYSYTLLNKSRIKLYKERLHVYITDVLSSNNKELNVSTFMDDLNARSIELSDEDRAEVLNKVLEKIKEVNQKYASFNVEKNEFEQIEQFFSDMHIDGKLKMKRYKRLFENLMFKFYRKFNDIHRPIIGIFNEETKSVEILAINFIKKEGNDNTQIDLKSVTHNSPYEIYIASGVTVVSMLYQMYCNKIDESSLIEITEYTVDENDTQDEYSEFEDNAEVFDEEKWLENLRKLESFIAYENIPIDELKDNDLNEEVKYILEAIKMKVNKSFKKNFEDNNFISGDIEIERSEEAV